MSDAELHRVATGRQLAEAIPLVDRLIGLAVHGNWRSVDVFVTTDSQAIPHYRRSLPPETPINYELLVPAEHQAAYDAALNPHLVGPARRWPEPGPAGGLSIAIHGTETKALEAVTPLPRVPLELTMYDLSPEAFNWQLVPTEHDHPARAALEWEVTWPAEPDLGIHQHTKHAAVCLLVNTESFWDPTPDGPGYQVLVSTETGGRARAAHLAATAGLTVADLTLPEDSPVIATTDEP